MIEVACARCCNTGWVCEAHDDRPWDGPRGCGGAGMPCPRANARLVIPISLPRLRQLRQRRKPAMRSQLIDKPRQSLGQLSDEFFFRET
jgi:hypothetical protein